MDESYKFTEEEQMLINTIRKSSDPSAAFILALEIIQQLLIQPPTLATPFHGVLPATLEIIE